MRELAVFQLKKLNAEPLFEGLASGPNESVMGRSRFSMDFLPEFPFGWDWEPTRLSASWRTPELVGQVSSFNDYPCVNLQVPAFSERAADSLKHFLAPNGELLPATWNGRRYQLFNCLKVVEILNHSETIGAFVDPGYAPKKGKLSIASSLSVLGIVEEKLSGLSVFEMRELPGQVFVTNEFVDCAIQNGLNGFDFIKAWPNDSNNDYLRQHLMAGKEKKVPVEIECSQTLEIQFAAWATASEEQRKQVQQFSTDVSFLLNHVGLNDAFPGRLDEKEITNTHGTLKFQCPDGERLLKRIEPGLLELSWPSQIKVTFSNPLDAQCLQNRAVLY